MRITINLPVSKDALGQWLESTGAELALSCALGLYIARVSWKRVKSYNDETGEHSEHWSLERDHVHADEAIRLALNSAMAVERGAIL